MRRGPAAALAALVAFGVAGLSAGARAAFKNVEVGSAPPTFAMKSLEGESWESSRLLGKEVTVVVFWASWSPRSREVLDDLERLLAELAPRRFGVVAINAEHATISAADREAIRSVLAGAKSSAVVLLDEGLVAFNDFGAMALPSSLVIDARGRVAYTLAGYPMTMRSDLADAVRKALGLPTSLELRPPQEYVPKNHALMYYNFGRRLLEKGQEEKAVEQFLIAVQRDPGFKKPHLELGLHHVRAGAWEQSRAAFLKVLEIDPQDPEAGYQAATANLRADRLEDARSLFAALASEFPDRGGYRLALAVTEKLLGREEAYRAGLEKAGGLLPPEPRVLYDLGAVAQRRNLLPLAAELYRRALEAVLR